MHIPVHTQVAGGVTALIHMASKHDDSALVQVPAAAKRPCIKPCRLTPRIARLLESGLMYRA